MSEVIVMRRKVMPAWRFLLLVVVIAVLGFANAAVVDGTVRYETVRSDYSEVGGLHRTREMLRRDIGRYRVISERHRRRSVLIRSTMRRQLAREDDAVSMAEPMTSARDYGIGQYVVQVKVGTPPKKFRLIADTGSDLTWMRCQYDRSRPRHRRSGVFLPANSSSFTTIPCSSRACKIDLANLFSLSRCPTPYTPCAYDFGYSDGSTAMGIFANETITADLTNGGEMKLEQMLIGCTESIQGQGLEAVDGVLGLANSDNSFVGKATGKFDRIFSYCLVDHLAHKSLSGYFSFGKSSPHSLPLPADHMRYTKLELDGTLSPLYGVEVLGISIGDRRMLRIPTRVWASREGGGTIVDSGTSLTVLVAPAYRRVAGALKASLSRYRRVSSADLEPLEYCFDSTGFDESLVPRLAVHFKDGARFEPPVKSYVIDAAPGIKCLGLLSARWPGLSVIGNILQQNHLWEFNLADHKLGFAPSPCT